MQSAEHLKMGRWIEEKWWFIREKIGESDDCGEAKSGDGMAMTTPVQIQ